jgi:hypothetical protein
MKKNLLKPSLAALQDMLSGTSREAASQTVHGTSFQERMASSTAWVDFARSAGEKSSLPAGST